MRYVGIPFRKLGRTREGLDCLGLVILWFREQVGLEIPDIKKAESWDEVRDLLRDNHWEKVPFPEKGDLVYLTPVHLGVCLGNNKVLHTTRDTGSVIERLNRSPVKERVLGFYRREGK